MNQLSGSAASSESEIVKYSLRTKEIDIKNQELALRRKAPQC
ncbi:hypothetical protein [Pseudanabaena sp. BC1403]|nr:hypothetical protein [Pseudanabaena sp. BC1403]